MSYRILFVDDDPFFQRVITDYLTARDFEVDTANSGELAVAMYKKGRYQLVLVDIIMPGLSGVELIQHIRAINSTQDVIVLSASEDVRMAVRAMQLGVYDYLVKPVEREELLMVIARLRERTAIYDEHARQLYENIDYAELQQLFQRGLRVLHSLEMETVCETLLATLCDVCRAQGGALWLGRGDDEELHMHGYRGLIEAGRLPVAVDFSNTALGDDLRAGIPVLASEGLPKPERQYEPSRALYVPLSREEKLTGVVMLTQKLGGGFDARDRARAKLVGDCGATAVRHARRYRQLERVGLRDPSTAAYNMTYFIDYLGRELHKARRYERSFAIVEVSLDNASELQQSLTPEKFSEALRQITQALTSVLRDVDVIARVSNEQMFILLPETDLLGSLTFVQRARDAVRGMAYLQDIDRSHPISLSFGPAAFPRDGDDFDQLFEACKRRIEESRRSVFRRMRLEDMDFWDAASHLIGPESAYDGESVNLPPEMSLLQGAGDFSKHHVFPGSFADLLRREIVDEAARQVKSAGWLFISGRWSGKAHDGAAESYVERVLRGDLNLMRTYILGSSLPPQAGSSEWVTPVLVEDEVVKNHEVVLFLAEHAAYGLIARRRSDNRLCGFHTADWTLVEGLIGKLQETYHLQRGNT